MKQKIASLSLLVLLMSGCTKERLSSGQLEVGLNSCSKKEMGTGTVTVCLDAVLNDSRCPRQSYCVWAGVAEARFVVKVDGEQHTISLSTPTRFTYANDTTVSGYRIRFADLLPYPGDGGSETRAIVFVSR